MATSVARKQPSQGKLFEAGSNWIQVEVRRVRFQDPISGWAAVATSPCAGKVDYRGRTIDEDDHVVVVGNFSRRLTEGMQMDLRAEWVRNQKFKTWQLSVEDQGVRWEAKDTPAGLERWLWHNVDGVGKLRASALVERFGTDLLRVAAEDPLALADVVGIGGESAAKIATTIVERDATDELEIELGEWMNTAAIAAVIGRFGAQAPKVVRENPFILMDVHGIGFKTADTVFLAVNDDAGPDDERRVLAGLRHVLHEQTRNKGHCYLPAMQLAGKASARSVLEVDVGSVRPHLGQFLQQSHVVTETQPRIGADDVLLAWPRNLHAAETNAAVELGRLRTANGPPLELPEDFRELPDLTLSEEQAAAVALAAVEKLLVLTGGPGTGKSTTLSAMIRLFQHNDLRIEMCAPTGRAAKRMEELTGHRASTIHRMLQYNPFKGWGHGPDERLPADVVVVDETSMVDVELMARLVRALRDETRLLLVGDVDQLPPVGPGKPFADLFEAAIPVVRLERIFRQAEASLIVTGAHAVNRGLVPAFGEPGDTDTDLHCWWESDKERLAANVVDLVTRFVPESYGIPPEDIWVLTPQHRTKHLGTRALNRLLQAELNPGGKAVTGGLKIGDRVMCVKNDYTYMVFNGDHGKLIGWDPDKELVTVDFDGRVIKMKKAVTKYLVPAYATSIHKSQGSQYEAVVVVVHGSHRRMNTRRLLYTAMTRAKSLCVVVGEHEALELAVTADDETKRNTRLAARLNGTAGPWLVTRMGRGATMKLKRMRCGDCQHDFSTQSPANARCPECQSDQTEEVR